MVDTPAHIDVIPKPFIYEPAPKLVVEKLQTLFSQKGISGIERALQKAKAPHDPSGYYRATLSNTNQKLFLRIAKNTRARRLIRADVIAQQTQSQIDQNLTVGCSCLIKPFCKTFDNDHMLLTYPWNNGHFINDITIQKMFKMGKNLQDLHKALNKKTKWSKTIKARTINRLKYWRALHTSLLNDIKSTPDNTTEKLCPYRKHDILELPETSIPLNSIEALFTQDAIKTHGDLHRGNILFDPATDMMTFLDFEEAEASFFNPLYDVAWLVERFCLTVAQREQARALSVSCLQGYLQKNDIETALQDIKKIIIGRNIIWLAVLNDGPIENKQTQHQEAEKFITLIQAAQRI